VKAVTVVGAGLAGTLAALFLARRGLAVTLLERRPDLRCVDLPAGRSINLALANRGLKPLRRAGLDARVTPLLTPMRGRMIHDPHGTLDFQPYGQRPHELIHSVSRPGLNAVLLDAAEKSGVEIRFGWRCVGADFEHDRLEFEDAGGRREARTLGPTVAADGAGSVLRQALARLPGHASHEELLPHGYKELSIPPGDGGMHSMEPQALHIWPRGGHMLIALPNLDGSFTVTLFLPLSGAPSFAGLGEDPARIAAFFQREFPDAAALMPTHVADFLAHPVGELGTVRCGPWHRDGQLVLLGDAAHAIVPFHGQGLNCAFEDCLALDDTLAAAGGDWSAAFAAFSRRRKPEAEAIADMALENYVEMRDSVRDPRFLLQKAVAFELERRFPERFVPRYSLVMFRDDVPYSEAQRRGRIQAAILDELTTGCSDPAGVDYEHAARLVGERLAPLGVAR
jgi:kynurenine 3-monooxygenase